MIFKLYYTLKAGNKQAKRIILALSQKNFYNIVAHEFIVHGGKA